MRLKMTVACKTRNCPEFKVEKTADITKVCCDYCRNNLRIIDEEDAKAHREAMRERRLEFQRKGWLPSDED